MKGPPAIPAREARPSADRALSGAFHGWALFFREALANPRDVGALIPSSRALARHMASLADISGDNTILELGAGTGVVTEALLERGIAPRRVIALERSASLADLLRTRFPEIRVICGDAADLRLLLRHGQRGNPTVQDTQIVSSLPLRIFSPDKVHAILREIAGVTRPGGRWIQYTYALGQREVPGGFTRLRTCFVWRNFPPARIDVFQPSARI